MICDFRAIVLTITEQKAVQTAAQPRSSGSQLAPRPEQKRHYYDPKEQMIEDMESRRERTHDAADQVESRGYQFDWYILTYGDVRRLC